MKRKILLIGYGSIGKKHYRILKTNFKNYNVVISSNHLKKKVNFTDKNKFYASIVATSASKHMVELKKLIKSRTHALIEKPLSNKTINPKLTESVLKKIKKDKILVQVGYCLRFHPAIKYLKSILNKIPKKNFLNISFITNSYLPNWRKGNYRKNVSVKKSHGGGVLNELSHEIDLLIYLFGKPKSLFAKIGNSKTLDLNVEDYADVIFKTKDNINLTMHIDFNSFPEKRDIEVRTKDKTIKIDLTKSIFYEFSKKNIKKKKFLLNPDYLYIKQFDHFLKKIRKKNFSHENFKESLQVLNIIRSIRKSSQDNKIQYIL